MIHRTKANSRSRSCSGQLLGAVDLLIVIPAAIACMFLLAEVGLGCFYMEKLQGCLNQASIYASSLQGQPGMDPATLQTTVATYLNGLLQTVGMPPAQMSDVKVTGPQAVSTGPSVMTVSAKVWCGLLSGCPIVPNTISINSTSVAMTNSSGLKVVGYVNVGAQYTSGSSSGIAMLPLVSPTTAASGYDHPTGFVTTKIALRNYNNQIIYCPATVNFTLPFLPFSVQPSSGDTLNSYSVAAPGFDGNNPVFFPSGS